MKVIFISGRITAPTSYQMAENVRHAHMASLKLMKRGYATICPHKNTEGLGGALHRDSEDDFEGWMAMDLEILSRCDGILMLKGWKQSRGSKREYAKAKELGLELMFEGDKK